MTETSTDKPFDQPLAVNIGGAVRSIASVRQALDLLSSTEWPGERGPCHRDAAETCLKVLDGHRSTIDARMRLIEAAREASALADD